MENESKASWWQNNQEKIVEFFEHSVSGFPFLAIGLTSIYAYRVDNSPNKSFLKSPLLHQALSAVGKVFTSYLVASEANQEKKSFSYSVLDTVASGFLISSGTLNNLKFFDILKHKDFLKVILGISPINSAVALSHAVGFTAEMDKFGKYAFGNYSTFGSPVVLKETSAQLVAQTFKYTGIHLVENQIGVGSDALSIPQMVGYASGTFAIGGFTYNIKKFTNDRIDSLSGKNVTTKPHEYREDFVAGGLNYFMYKTFDRFTKFPNVPHEKGVFEAIYKSHEVLSECLAGGAFETVELVCHESKMCEVIGNATSPYT